jgi:cytochrome oxidase assembly protein ShyY1
MHPGSPIFGSGAWRIQIYFLLLLVLTLLAAWQLARLWYGINNPYRVQATSFE